MKTIAILLVAATTLAGCIVVPSHGGGHGRYYGGPGYAHPAPPPHYYGPGPGYYGH